MFEHGLHLPTADFEIQEVLLASSI
jgi:hypothetical protein